MPEAHGGIRQIELNELGLHADQITDFSVNSNPYGGVLRLADHLSCVDLKHYPDPDNYELRRLLARANQMPEDCVAVANGSVEIIWACVRAWMKTNDVALVIAPTFGEYHSALNIIDAKSVEILLDINHGEINLENIISNINRLKPKLTFVCNPNNPTGHLYSDEQISTVSKACSQHSGLLILDEAYRAFSGQPQFAANPYHNVIVLRSMTKDFSIPGLRLGYALAQKQFVDDIHAQCPPWNVSALAQKGGEFVMGHVEQIATQIDCCRLEAVEFRGQLCDLGFEVLPSKTHYFLVKVRQATEFRLKLLKQKILVRDCTSFGLPEYVRISTRTADDNQKLIKCLQSQN